MLKQIKTLTGLQLKNLYGLNVFRYTKDKGVKKKTILLGCAWIYIIAMVLLYIGGTAYGYITIGAGDILPAYLIMLASMVILAFAMFKAGDIIFQRNAYDILASLPISQFALVVSRFIRMYVENLLLTLLVMLPGMVVYAVMVKPSVVFYLVGAVVILFVPLLPITVATFLGAIITAIASRMKHKSLVTAALSILFVLGIMAGTSKLASIEEEKFTMEMLQNLSEIAQTAIEAAFPPAVWMGNAMLGKGFGACALYMFGALAIFGLTMILVSSNYYSISERLYSITAKHDYKMQTLQKTPILKALFKREVKRYFASSAYVTNTIIGPIMAVAFSAGMLGFGIEEMQRVLEISIDFSGYVPFMLAGIFCVMGTTCTSISLEGKEWWIVKSLPIRTKDLLDAKLLLNLLLDAPAYLVSEILLIIALKPDMVELFWLIMIPAVSILFSCVFGLFANLKLPVFNWENEVTIVKQSASAGIGGIGGFLVIIASVVPVIFTPEEYVNLTKGLICVLLAGVTFVLYHKNNRVNLMDL